MKLKVTGTTDATITLNKNSRILRGREIVIISADTHEQQAEISGLNGAGLVSVEEITEAAAMATNPISFKKVEQTTNDDSENSGKAVFINESIEAERRELVHMTSDLIPSSPITDNDSDIPETDVRSFKQPTDASEQMGRQATVSFGGKNVKVAMKNSAIPGSEAIKAHNPFIAIDGTPENEDRSATDSFIAIDGTPEDEGDAADPRFIET